MSIKPRKLTKPSSFKKYWAPILAFGIIALLLLLYFCVPGFQHFIQETWSVLSSKNEKNISLYFKDFGLWGPLIIIVLTAIQMFFILFPNVVLIVVAVLAYGPVWGTIISLTGNVAASSVGYIIGKAFGKQARKILKGKKLKNMQHFLDRYGFGAVVIFHICPFISNDAISIAAGISQMKFWKYMFAAMAGAIPFTIAVAWFGKETETLKTGLYWIGGGGLLVYFIYVWLDHRKKQRVAVK